MKVDATFSTNVLQLPQLSWVGMRSVLLDWGVKTVLIYTFDYLDELVWPLPVYCTCEVLRSKFAWYGCGKREECS